MSERDVAAAAMRWFLAREKRIAEKKVSCVGNAFYAARHAESAALLGLRRICRKHKAIYKQAEDVEMIIDVPMLECINEKP